MPNDFDPMRDVRFRGKPIAALTEPELRAALVQALDHIHFLEATRPQQAYLPVNYAEPAPIPPMIEFS
jgi:hypothetical protein